MDQPSTSTPASGPASSAFNVPASSCFQCSSTLHFHLCESCGPRRYWHGESDGHICDSYHWINIWCPQCSHQCTCKLSEWWSQVDFKLENLGTMLLCLFHYLIIAEVSHRTFLAWLHVYRNVKTDIYKTAVHAGVLNGRCSRNQFGAYAKNCLLNIKIKIKKMSILTSQCLCSQWSQHTQCQEGRSLWKVTAVVLKNAKQALQMF